MGDGPFFRQRPSALVGGVGVGFEASSSVSAFTSSEDDEKYEGDGAPPRAKARCGGGGGIVVGGGGSLPAAVKETTPSMSLRFIICFSGPTGSLARSVSTRRIAAFTGSSSAPPSSGGAIFINFYAEISLSGPLFWCLFYLGIPIGKIRLLPKNHTS